MPAQIESAIPLGRRIGEIMEEKGDAFSYRAFGERIGISKDILSRCINGDRYIKPSELEKICRGLNIREARLRQLDYIYEYDELIRLLQSKANPKRAILLAETFAQIAIGMTEKSLAFNLLGRAYFSFQQYDEAHRAWLEAYSNAQKVNERYGEHEVLGHIVKNLMLSFTARKEYIMMSELIEEAERQLRNQPQHMGAISYSRARLAHQLGDIQEAKKRMYESHKYFEIAGDRTEIGIAKINVAHLEYKTKSYGKARKLLEGAIEYLGKDHTTKWIALKEYVKVLLKIGEKAKAIDIIYQTIEDERVQESSEIYARFNLLLASAENNVKLALDVLEMEGISNLIRYSACVVLMKHYMQLGDSVSLMRYYEIAEPLAINKTDLLDMEGF